jgi:Fe-S cluster biogenesis protein NfuA
VLDAGGTDRKVTMPKQMRADVADALKEIRPLLRRDGGDVELVDVDDAGVVRVRLLGACVDCPSSDFTLTAGIDRRVRSAVPSIVRVERV